MWSTLVIALIALFSLAFLIAVFKLLNAFKRKAEESGHNNLSQYLQATPRTDAEKRDAVDLALKGMVICIVGLVLPPLLLIGIFPLYFGARKLAYAELGFGLYEDSQR